MKLWQKALNSANNAYIFGIMAFVALYLGYTNQRLGFVLIAFLFFAAFVLSVRASRRRIRKLREKL